MLLMVSCEDMNGIGANGGFDPLQVPGGPGAEPENFGGPQRIRPGEFVVAAIPNTAFYNQRPGPEAEADQLLKLGTSMRVISGSGSFHRVELDSGEIGFVPTVMIEPANAVSEPVDSTLLELHPLTPRTPEPEPELPVGMPGEFIPDIEPAPEPTLEPELDAPTPDI